MLHECGAASAGRHMSGAVGGPAGPVGPMGPQGPQGLQGEGLVSGSLLFLPEGVAPPAGYRLIGTQQINVRPPQGGAEVRLRVAVYQRQ